MLLREFEDRFLSELACQLSDYGLSRKRDLFFRSTGLGRCSFRIGFTKKIYGVDIRAYNDVRFDAVEDLVGRYPSNRFRKVTATLSSEIGLLGSGSIKTWSVKFDVSPHLGDVFLNVVDSLGMERQDLYSNPATVVKEILEAFREVTLPFFEKYGASLENALAVLVSDSEETNRLCPMIEGRAKRAIVMAFLLRDRGRFEEVIEKMEKLLVQTDHFDLDNFRQLRSFLETSWERGIEF